MLFKNTASQRVRVFAFDATTGLPKTGDAANLTAYVAKDYGAVTVLADTSATEEDATNAKGYYWFDISQTETNADNLMVTAKSSTSNIVVVGAPAMIATRPPNAGALSIDASGRVDLGKILGTASAGAVGYVGVDWGQVTNKTTTNALTGTTIATTQQVDVNTIKTQAVTCAAGVTVLASVGTASASTAQTGDAYVRLGAPAGASVSADVAAVKAVLPAALVSGRIDASVGAMASGVVTAAAVATDAIDADALAADAVAEIQSGLSTLNAAGVRTAVGLGSANLDTQLAAIAGYIDTEVATLVTSVGAGLNTIALAIKAKTDNLPAAPAATTDIPSVGSIADAVWDEVQSGHTTAGTFGKYLDAAVSGVSTGGVSAADIADAVLGRNLAGGSDGGRTVRDGLRFLRNKWTRTATTLTVYEEDDSTPAWTSVLVSSSSADPVTSSDPG